MLNPDHRRLYTDALRPPPNYVFGDALAATYSLNLETLLTIPLHLALFSADRPLEELLKDSVALLESIRRTASRVTVFVESARVLAPNHPHVLYGLLEPTVVEVLPPDGGGSFHPKLWLIRFEHPETGAERVRLLVLTRNVTNDRCWDLALTLDGEPGNRPAKRNRGLAELLSTFPRLATGVVDDARRERVEMLAELAHWTEWELPDPFDDLHFHVLGLNGRPTWKPRDSHRLAVISPFVSDAALSSLASSSSEAAILVSRPESLAALDPATLARFDQVRVLAEQAEREDGEDLVLLAPTVAPLHGLHAKAYVAWTRWDTHLYVGSANATNPALVNGTNVELIAELVGRRSRGLEMEDLFGAGGFGSILTDFVPDTDAEPPDPLLEEARETLELARRKIVAAGLRLQFEEAEGSWSIKIKAEPPLKLDGISTARVWLATRQNSTAVAIDATEPDGLWYLPAAPLPLLTTFVVFELTSAVVDESIRFVLNLPADSLPVAQRDAAILRDVIRNRAGFLRYIMLLLAEAGEGSDPFGTGGGFGAWGRFDGRSSDNDELPVFEYLTRAFCRQPEQLETIRRLIQDFGTEGTDEVVPPEFLELWAIFADAIGEPVEAES